MPLGDHGDDSLQPCASFIYNMENQLQTCLLVFPAAERESGSCLRQAFPENVVFWEWGEKNPTMLCIKHRIIQKTNRYRDICGIRISFF